MKQFLTKVGDWCDLLAARIDYVLVKATLVTPILRRCARLLWKLGS